MYINKYNKYVRKAIYLTGGLLGGSFIGYSTISHINKYYTNKLTDENISKISTTNISDNILIQTQIQTKIPNLKIEEYKYKLVNYKELIEWLIINPELKKSIETCIQDLRGYPFKVEQLKKEEGEKDTLYFFIYNNQEMITSSRLFYFSDSFGYINFVYTNPKYRGHKMCQKNIKLLVQLTTDVHNIKIYELDVEIDNISAIKCYENNGFIKVIDTIKELYIKNKMKKVQTMRLDKNVNEIR